MSRPTRSGPLAAALGAALVLAAPGCAGWKALSRGQTPDHPGPRPTTPMPAPAARAGPVAWYDDPQLAQVHAMPLVRLSARQKKVAKVALAPVKVAGFSAFWLLGHVDSDALFDELTTPGGAPPGRAEPRRAPGAHHAPSTRGHGKKKGPQDETGADRTRDPK